MRGRSLLAVFVYLNNASSLAPPINGMPTASRPPRPGANLPLARAHQRDLHREPHRSAAARLSGKHACPRCEAAFDAGADIVEFDIHPTTDGHFAVFHDWTVDCRTEGNGVTREHTLAELKALDIGYGYTADGGKTFPFRGKGVGLMPSLDEVLAAFPGKRFLINIKSNDSGEGTMLAQHLARLSPAHARLADSLRRQPPDRRAARTAPGAAGHVAREP